MVVNNNRHSRTQNVLLLSKLIDCRDSVSPFTLVLDSLEQKATPLISACVKRCGVVGTSVVLVSFETLKPPHGVKHFIRAHSAPLVQIQAEVKTTIASLQQSNKRCLVIFDTLHPILANSNTSIASYLSELITPLAGLLCVYHTDMPTSTIENHSSSYGPDSLTLLRFLATAVLTLHSVAHAHDEKMARDRSVAAPTFGLQEPSEGVIQGLGSQDPRGVVIEMEHRRRSGRSVHATYLLTNNKASAKHLSIIMLDEHPDFMTQDSPDGENDGVDSGEVSFNLSLTEKQRRDRENIVLPYFDAQNDAAAPGEGGRILYDMGVEDDFDDEEDEI